MSLTLVWDQFDAPHPLGPLVAIFAGGNQAQGIAKLRDLLVVDAVGQKRFPVQQFAQLQGGVVAVGAVEYRPARVGANAGDVQERLERHPFHQRVIPEAADAV